MGMVEGMEDRTSCQLTVFSLHTGGGVWVEGRKGRHEGGAVAELLVGRHDCCSVSCPKSNLINRKGGWTARRRGEVGGLKLVQNNKLELRQTASF